MIIDDDDDNDNVNDNISESNKIKYFHYYCNYCIYENNNDYDEYN